MLFKMYRDHFGTIPVEVTGDSPQPKPTFPAGGDQPAVNPGSDTYPLDVSAAGRSRRLATLGPGVAFGELALLDEATRSATCEPYSLVMAASFKNGIPASRMRAALYTMRRSAVISVASCAN